MLKRGLVLMGVFAVCFVGQFQHTVRKERGWRKEALPRKESSLLEEGVILASG